MKKRQNRMPIRRAPEIEFLDSIERWGNDVETAVRLALDELKADIEEVEVEVLEEPSKGFFGIGAKLAKVRVTKKNIHEEVVPAIEEASKKKERGPIRKEELTEEEKNSINSTKENRKERDNRDNRSRGKNRNKGGNHKDTPKEVTNEPEKEAQNDVVNEASIESRLPEEPIVPMVDIASLTNLDDNNEGLMFLKNISKEMGLEVNIEGKTDGKDMFFFIEGKDSGTIIGKRGATLDAIQYLTSLVVNKEGKDYIRVVVDAENYRSKREKSLEKLAIRLADKVARTKRSYKLEPMNPYERKVIHATLQGDSRIKTRSEGQDPSRRVIIEVK